MIRRALSILKLFTVQKPILTIEEIAAAIGVSVSSGYRQVSQLEETGLLAKLKPRMYILGPAIIQYDRQIQLTDPLLTAARPIMAGIASMAPAETVLVLCRVYGETVLCIDRVQPAGPPTHISYERGRPMPIFLGATSKIILAHRPSWKNRALYERHKAEIERAELGGTWQEFKVALSRLRRSGTAVTFGEVDAGKVGIAAPILNEERVSIGSLSFVAEERVVDLDVVTRLATLVTVAARQIELAMQAIEAPLVDRDGEAAPPAERRVETLKAGVARLRSMSGRGG